MRRFRRTLVFSALILALTWPTAASARPLLGTGDHRTVFMPVLIASPNLTKARTDKNRPGIWLGNCRTGDILVAFDSDSRQVVSAYYNWDEAIRLFGSAGMIDMRRWKKDTPTSNCILWYDGKGGAQNDQYGRLYHTAYWTSPSDLWGRYDTVMVLRPKGATAAQGVAAMDWAISKTSGKYIALSKNVLNGSWYYKWGVLQVLQKWRDFLKPEWTEIFRTSAEDAVVEMSASVWLDRVAKVKRGADEVAKAFEVIEQKTSQKPPIGGSASSHDNWYGAKAAYHAWAYARRVNGADQHTGLVKTTNGGHMVLPIDMVSGGQMSIIQWWR